MKVFPTDPLPSLSQTSSSSAQQTQSHHIGEPGCVVSIEIQPETHLENQPQSEPPSNPQPSFPFREDTHMAQYET